MKVFTFYYNRYETATTSIQLNNNGIEHFVLLHNENDLQKFNKHNTIKGKPIITNESKGLAYQRNKALEMVDTDEWCVFMCDDFIRIRSLPKEWIISKTNSLPIDFKNQQKFRLKSSNNICLKEMFDLFPYLIKLADKNNIKLIGFGLHDNPLNLKNKFTHRGLADGRFWLIKKSDYVFDLNAQLIDDVAWTAENLVRHNNVLILNWLVPYFKRYSSGGFGSTEERKLQRKKECNYLANKYNPLVQIAKKVNWDYGTHIRLYATDNNILKAKKNVIRW